MRKKRSEPIAIQKIISIIYLSYIISRNLLKAQLIPYHQLNIPQNPSSGKMNMDQRNNSSSLNNDKGTSRKRCPQMSSGKDREIKISYGCRNG